MADSETTIAAKGANKLAKLFMDAGDEIARKEFGDDDPSSSWDELPEEDRQRIQGILVLAISPIREAMERSITIIDLLAVQRQATNEIRSILNEALSIISTDDGGKAVQ